LQRVESLVAVLYVEGDVGVAPGKFGQHRWQHLQGQHLGRGQANPALGVAGQRRQFVGGIPLHI